MDPSKDAAQMPVVMAQPIAFKPLPPVPGESYEVKRIEFLGKKVPTLLQSKNGPCPLLAIANQLLLSNRMTLPEPQEDVTLDALVHMVAERLIDANPINENTVDPENKRKAVADAIETLPTLAKGLDVNVKFADVDLFEFDRNIAVFDMLDVTLYHGWVIDPLDTAFAPLRSLTYNTLVEYVVNFDHKFGNDPSKLAAAIDDPELNKMARDGELAQRFLDQNASQLTYFGLAKLHEKVKEREICAFFRNNHFTTMFKYEGHLYLLCTDSGYKTRAAVAWERLTDINGDTELCSPAFGDPNAFLSAADALEEISADEALAQQLQLEEDIRTGNTGSQQPHVSMNHPMSPDEALARQLQLEEDEQASRQQPRQQQPARAAPNNASDGRASQNKPSMCAIC